MFEYFTNTETGSNPNPLPTNAVMLENKNIIIADQFNDRVFAIDPMKNKVWQYGVLNTSGNVTEMLNGPYTGFVIGDYTGQTKPPIKPEPNQNPELTIIKKEEHNEEDNIDWRDDYRPTVAMEGVIPMYGSPMYSVPMYGNPMIPGPIYGSPMYGSEPYGYGSEPYELTETLNSESSVHKAKANLSKHKHNKSRQKQP